VGVDVWVIEAVNVDEVVVVCVELGEQVGVGVEDDV
jgi:hypothetical protein